MAKRLDLKDLNIYYGAFHAVQSVSLSVEPRSVTAFIGPSGCGKTTMLRAFNRMHDVIPGARVAGTLRYHGVDLYGPEVSATEVRRRMRALDPYAMNGRVAELIGLVVEGLVQAVDLADASVGDALTFEEEGGIAFVSRDAPVDEARELFLSFPTRHSQRLRAVVITENGRPTEAPLGLITASDLVELGE